MRILQAVGEEIVVVTVSPSATVVVVCTASAPHADFNSLRDETDTESPPLMEYCEIFHGVVDAHDAYFLSAEGSAKFDTEKLSELGKSVGTSRSIKLAKV